MHAYDDSLTENYQFRVILPEGATNIQIELPASLKKQVSKVELGKYFGTLDFIGRPMISVSQKNTIHDLHNEIVRVRYTFNSRDFYLEPGYVFAMIFSLFLTSMIYSNLSLNLKDEKKSKKVDSQEGQDKLD